MCCDDACDVAILGIYDNVTRHICIDLILLHYSEINLYL